METPIRPTLLTIPEALAGPRTLLRAHHPDHADAMFAAIDESRQHLHPWMEWCDEHQTAADTRDYCLRSAAAWLLRTSLGYGIFARETGRFLGAAGFAEIDWQLRSFMVGYWLRASATGHGYAVEATRLLADCAFTSLSARRIALTCDTANTASRRVAERAGFVLEARLRNARLTSDGAVSDTLVFSLTPDDWPGMYGNIPQYAPIAMASAPFQVRPFGHSSCLGIRQLDAAREIGVREVCRPEERGTSSSLPTMAVAEIPRSGSE